MGDPRQLHERISYLLMSMAKFTAAGGSLLLETGPNEQQAAVQISKIGAVIPDDELVDFLVMITTGPQSGGELNADNAQVTVTLPLA